jgi:hypothetical protein
MYAGYELLRELTGQPGARLLAGHDPAVLGRFPQVNDSKGPLGVRLR